MIIPVLWFLAVVGSQFYLFDSGMPQPSHILLALILAAFFLKRTPFPREVVRSLKRNGLIPISIFILYVVAVNSIFSIINQDIEFILSTIFWLFSFATLLILSFAFDDERILFAVKAASVVGIALMFLLWALGLGRYNFFPRYNAFLNDPNQMAYWVLCMMGTFALLSRKSGRLLQVALLVLSTFLILASMSRSAILGVVFLFLGSVIKIAGQGKRGVFVGVMLVVGLTAAAAYYATQSEIVFNALQRFTDANLDDQAEIRGYGRILNFPEYLILGAGQGLDERFGASHEIHSSWGALLFYYGVIGLSVFMWFLMSFAIRLNIEEKLVFCAPVFYGLSTYGLRTPAFWFFVASAIYVARRKSFIREELQSRNGSRQRLGARERYGELR